MTSFNNIITSGIPQKSKVGFSSDVFLTEVQAVRLKSYHGLRERMAVLNKAIVDFELDVDFTSF